MNDGITLGAAAWVATISVASLAARWALTPVRPGRHRAADRLPSEGVPCGPPSPYADPWADTQVFGVVKTGFGWCGPCASTTAGVITQNGFRCGEFFRHPAGAEAAS